ncbi:peptidoglycan editing factor PgeF [Sulfurihydrogenibium sp.]|uniref:peptidoglycan editing factor PgeF n=1 Tax=Sulfurihydrogenibium sp. TaxID=2053621 RepID=UPI00262A2C64|nr:peptidoglycan editing factor PgeF [Sulfurihydrogenibium sp.]
MRYFTFYNVLIAFTEKEDSNQRNLDNIKKTVEKLRIKNVLIPNQKHTNIVLKVDDYKNQECDGLYTDKKESAVGVLTADCIPVVLFNDDEIAVIHAGWRGLFGGVIENGFSMFKNKKVKAFIGPSIRGCCYEVDKQFVNDLNIDEKFYKIYDSKAYLDLVKIAKSKLETLKVEEIFDVGQCTKCSGKYFSYRNGDFESRILTLGMIKETKWD